MSRIALLYALTAVLAWGLAPIFDTILKSGVSAWTATFIRTIAAMIIITVVAWRAGAFEEIRLMIEQGGAASGEGEPVAAWLIIVAAVGSALLAGLIGQIAYYQALGLADTSRVVPITSSYPLVAALASIVIFREGFSWPKLAGALLIVVGVMLVSGVFTQAEA
jgi:transporter family protein